MEIKINISDSMSEKLDEMFPCDSAGSRAEFMALVLEIMLNVFYNTGKDLVADMADEFVKGKSESSGTPRGFM